MTQDHGASSGPGSQGCAPQPATPSSPVGADPSRSATADSDDYTHTFYGILNKQGEFWTPLPFHDEEAARAHLSKWAVGKYRSVLDTHKIVPVRVRLSTDAGLGLAPEVRRLVIAARRACYEMPEVLDEGIMVELDRAVEAFADDVPWDDAPDDRDSDASLAEDAGTAAEPRSGGSADPKGIAHNIPETNHG